MNIIRLTTRIFPDKGGPARYAYMLSKNLSSEQFTFFNITCLSEDSRNQNIKKVNPNFKIIYLPLTVPSHEQSLIFKLLFIIKWLYFSLKKSINLHRKKRIDLIHSDNPSITGITALILNKVFKIPFLYTQHGIESPYLFDYLFELNLIYPTVKKYIIVSRKMERYFKANDKDIGKLEWIPNGVNIDEFYHAEPMKEKGNLIDGLGYSGLLKPSDFIIICIGYMELKQKVLGMMDLLYGFKNFVQELDPQNSQNIKLVYIGTGEYEDILKKEINKINLENVLFLGKQNEIKKFYAISDLCCLTSYMEGFPTVLLEAIASKVPCIATDVGENRELLSDESLVETGNVSQISQKIKLFYENETLRKRVKLKNLKRIQKFDWEIIGKKLKSLYIRSIFNQ